ncbi:U-box domain-containing protein 13 [Phtheirospermum japonicum]|uniref:U-box domain-containing protein 13 n=1 Tax=Phtheirospermum japonicum TaxID=374723 RepID=A0A830DJ14_9LAMI|nr:U-box domain-containing protein 13 [Phtheirospermum japonicum]
MAWGTMSKCEGDDKDPGPGSVVLERPLRLWSLLIDSVRCGRGLQRPSNPKKQQQTGSEKLSELLKQAEWWENDQEEVRKKEEALQRLKNVANKLQQEEEISMVLDGAAEVRRLAKDDPEARTTLALLGVIPPLVALLDSQDPTFHSQIAALYALLNLAITNDANKAAIVKAGAVHKMLQLIQSCNKSISEAVVANFLGLSALDSNKPIIGSSGAIPFLVQTLKDVNVNGIAKHDSLRALYNLSISPSNVPAMVETDLIPHLFTKLGDDMDMSERILSIFGNVVSVAEGRKRISGVSDAFPILVDIFNWTDSPGCQEKASYILMVMAHKSYADRQAMTEAGVVSSCLELTLLGSLLAQKRASRLLECVRMEKGKHTVVSAPLTSSSLCSDPTSNNSEPNEESMDEIMSQESKAVKQLVQQSLHNNMKRMVKRANLPHDFVPSDHFKLFTSSKSLPF